MKRIFFSAALMLAGILSFTNKANAQCPVLNEMPCPITVSVTFPPPCGGPFTMTVPPFMHMVIGPPGCGPAISVTITDGINTYTASPGSHTPIWMCNPLEDGHFNIGPGGEVHLKDI